MEGDDDKKEDEPPKEEEPKAEGDEEGEDKKKKDDDVETDSDADYEEISIKKQMSEFRHKLGAKERFPQEMMNEAVRWRLNQNDCQNRGYVLDGYPFSFDTAYGVFFIVPKRPEKKMIINDEGEEVPAEDEMDEEELRKMLKPKFQANIFPESLILLRGTDDVIRSKAK